jgi:hypothetical protein
MSGLQAPDEGLRRGQPDGDALAGERVDVPRGVADEEGTPERRARARWPQRAGAEHPSRVRSVSDALAQRGNRSSHRSYGAPAAAEDGDPDAVRRDRGDVGLGVRRPVHLDEVGPRCDGDVAAKAVADPPGRRPLESQASTQR